MKDILLIDKPKDITSFDCIRRLRSRFPRGTKLGHAGTLDPIATGLMIIGVGKGTKKLGNHLKLDKTYEAEILLGVCTDTGDITGEVLRSQNIKISQCRNILEALRGMVGELELPVPRYSAIKRGGEPLYKKARRGEHIDPPRKTMTVYSAKLCGAAHSRDVANTYGRRYLLHRKGTSVRIRFDVSSGTYIRSLAEEFGRRLGVPATLAGLRRTRIGEFAVEDAQTL